MEVNYCLLSLYYIFNYIATICETFKLIEALSVYKPPLRAPLKKNSL